MESESFIGIRVNGNLLHIARESNEGRDDCGESSYMLVGPDDWQYDAAKLFKLADEEAAKSFLLAGSQSWYNSDATQPDWGHLTRADMEFVKIDVVVTLTPVSVNLPEIVDLSSLVADYDRRKIIPSMRRHANLPADVSEAVIIWRKGDGSDLSPEAFLLAVRGKEVRIGDHYWSVQGVADVDSDSYYAFLRRERAPSALNEFKSDAGGYASRK